jgi:glycosyltransferase involved in cell wall biosynthesis
MEKQNNGKRKAIVILGMHRSGTSALTRTLNLCGVDVGSNLMPPGAGDNVKGFWEHLDIFQANEKLLYSLNSSWDDVRDLPTRWWTSDFAEAYKLKIISILERDFSNSPLWGVKDPRICRLLPLWHQILEQTDNIPIFFIIVRNPLEVAASLAKRDGFSEGKSCLLWLKHLMDSEKGTRNSTRIFVTYEELLSDWKGLISRAQGFFRLNLPNNLKKAGPKINAFLENSLRHNKVADSILIKNKNLSRWIKDAYFAVKDITPNEDTQLIKTLDSIETELKEAGTLYEPAFTDIWAKYLDYNIRLEETNQQINDFKNRNEKLSQEKRHLQSNIDELQNYVKEKNELIRQLDVRVKSINTLLADRDKQIDSLNQTLKDVQATITTIYKTKSWRITAPLRTIDRSFKFTCKVPTAILSAIHTNGLKWFLMRIPKVLFAKDNKNFFSHMIPFVNNYGTEARHSLNKHSNGAMSVSAESMAKLPELPSNAKKIIVISHDAHFAGAQILALNMIRVLRTELFYEVAIVLMGPGELETEFQKYGKLYKVSRNPHRQDEIASLAATLWHAGYRTALCNTIVTGLIAAIMRQAGIRILSLVHELQDTIIKLGLESAAHELAVNSAVIVFPAQIVQDAFLTFASADRNKMFILPQGVFLDNPFKDNRNSAHKLLRIKYGLPSEQVIVLGIGYGDLRKGIDIFIDVALASAQEKNDITYIWIGDIDPHLHKQIKSKLSNVCNPQLVIFPGVVRDKSSYSLFVAGANIFLMTSREDPFPSVILDAMSVGMPVIGFEGAGGFCDMLRQGCGLLVPYLNAKEMNRALIRLLNDEVLFTSISARAKETAVSQFKFKDYVRRLLSLLERSDNDEKAFHAHILTKP